ncbi:hypothetical protein [Streptomyces sp. NRRL F-4474]|uniref:hypothetical protein n=1 Tax=Streptomyces sp. NRRL F-4474 TaxID=1463851 RepID=UPI000689BB2A|nr:hypothetical protein [Streptomyces sp. NRRL F-4474]
MLTKETEPRPNTLPDRPSTAGPASVRISPPVFKDCTTDAPGLRVSVKTDEQAGPWQVLLQHGSPSTARLSVPAGGLSGAATAVQATADGTWGERERSALLLDRAQIPVKITGSFFCATSVTTATITARYAVTDTTDPTRRVTVGAG